MSDRRSALRLPLTPLFVFLAVVAVLTLGCSLLADGSAADTTVDAEAGQAIFQHACQTCHTLGGGKRIGPDLLGVHQRRSRDWLVRFLEDPIAMTRSDPIAERLVVESGGLQMADPELDRRQIVDVLSYLESVDTPPRSATKAESRPARRLLLPPPQTLSELRHGWELLVPFAVRPTVPPRHLQQREHFAFAGGSGKLLIIDGEDGRQVAQIGLGSAVRGLRLSASGRHLYVLVAAGRLALIDLWSAPPRLVAEARACFDGRSLSVSGGARHGDLWVAVGCGQPPQYVVFDGYTLEPQRAHGVLGITYDTAEALTEEQIIAFEARPDAAEWLLALRQSGYLAIVDYAHAEFPIVAEIAAERPIDDVVVSPGGRFAFAVSAARRRVAVIDLEKRQRVARLTTGSRPRPTTAFWSDPEHGRVWALLDRASGGGGGELVIYGIDSRRNASAWQVVRRVPLASDHARRAVIAADKRLWIDFIPRAAPAELCAFELASLTDAAACREPFPGASLGSFVFAGSGRHVWVAGGGQEGALIRLASDSLREEIRIPGLEALSSGLRLVAEP